MTQTLEIERNGRVATVWMNRPDVHNAFDEALIAELTSTCEALDQDASVRVVVLAGRGKSFSAGADLNWMKRAAQNGVQENLRDARALARMLRVLAEMKKPTIARVQGAALGGGTGLTAACDIAVASTKAVFGSWDYNRFDVDHNHVLVPGKFGVRLLGLYQDAKGWRKWDLNEQKRLTGAFSYQPWRNTAVRGSYQSGSSANNISLPWNALDSLNTWIAAGRPVADATAVPTTTGFGTGNRYTLLSQESLMVNFRSKFYSARAPANTLLSPAMMGYAYNLTGPGGLRTQNFNDWQVKVEQRLTKGLVAEVAYFHNVNRILTRGNINPNLFLTGDPNISLSTMGGATMANPHLQQMYLEDNWGRDPFKDINDTLRVSAA